MPVRPEEIATRNFVVSWRGYNQEEVRSYLRVLANDQATLLSRIAELESPGVEGHESTGVQGALVPTAPDAGHHRFASLIDRARSEVNGRRSRLHRLRQATAGPLAGER